MPYAVVYGQNHERSTHWVVSEDAAIKIILSERWRLPLNEIVAAQAAIIEHLADGNRRITIETPRLAELIVDYLSR